MFIFNELIDKHENTCHQTGHYQIVKQTTMIPNHRWLAHKAIIPSCQEVGKKDNGIDSKSHLAYFPNIPFFNFIISNKINQAVSQEGPMSENIVHRRNMRERKRIKDWINQGHDRTKNSNQGKLLFKKGLIRGKKNYPHSHATMVKRESLR